MQSVAESHSFPQSEEVILDHWRAIDAFQTSLKRSEGLPEYSFYDGPPFATGLPHYGHILAGTIKDIVTMYAHQTGHHVVRRFGWDCHGLPVEFEIDKKLGVQTRADVERIGIAEYNRQCREIVMRYSGEWETTVERLGRWIDFKNDYKTLDLSFMESVWWVFSQLFAKELVYRGFKVMPYSTRCGTPLSNFEANLLYKDVDDPAVVVSFPLVEQEGVSLLAWTTTPWTLPSNLALCVNPSLEYVCVLDHASGHRYVLLESRLSEVYKLPAADKKPAEASQPAQSNNKKPANTKPAETKPAKAAKKADAPPAFTIERRMLGSELAGLHYTPLFDYFASWAERGAFRVLTDGYVTADSGTGVVHCAPAFGEDDYRVCLEHGVMKKDSELACPVDDNGRFTAEVPDLAGIYVKDADRTLLDTLKKLGRLVVRSTIRHSYPFCWRSETPLIYKAVPCWFIRVEQLRERLLANNLLSTWVPAFVQERRFHNWLRDARDWAVSRNRFWGTPMPLWASEDFSEVRCVASVAELELLSGAKITDLHRESIDHLTIPSADGTRTLRRVPEVFDCWFESGSMPYAQLHYPFENQELFAASFPADFIAEGIDQTRGWFYTLLVLSTALFDKPPFKNLIVNGLVLAEDGKKMSKRLKNYPDPVKVTTEYGADALRLYLINSPVVRAETLRFQEKGVRDVIKEVFLPWFHAYRFLVQSVRAAEADGVPFVYAPERLPHLSNVMDQWILSAAQSLVLFVRTEMEAYRLYTVVPGLLKFIEQLTNWYVRLNRDRLKGRQGRQDREESLNTLYDVMHVLCVAMAPCTPFLTEFMYQNLRLALPVDKREDSVHYLMYPKVRDELVKQNVEQAVGRMQTVIDLGRQARDRRTMPLKHPLREVTIVQHDPQHIADLALLQEYIVRELNVRNIVLTQEEGSYIKLRARPDYKVLGVRLRGDMKKVMAAINALGQKEIEQLKKDGQITLEGYTLSMSELNLARSFAGNTDTHEAADNGQVIVILDLSGSQALHDEGVAAEVCSHVQKARKRQGLLPKDAVELLYATEDVKLAALLEAQCAFIESKTGSVPRPVAARREQQSVLEEFEVKIDGAQLRLFLLSPQL